MKKRSRWTVLDVEESVIKTIKKYAKQNGLSTAKAIKDLVAIALKKG